MSRRNSYNEDVFLTVFTEKYGKMNVVAKRSKSYKSPLNASTRVFVCSDFIFKPASVPIVLHADIVQSHLSLLDDLDRIASAAYLCELVNLTTREEFSEQDIYRLLKDCLSYLCRTEARLTLMRAFFIARLCRELGVLSTESEHFSNEIESVLMRHRIVIEDIPRCVRFLHYLIQSELPRLMHAKNDTRLFSETVTVCETILRETLDIPPIKSTRLMDL